MAAKGKGNKDILKSINYSLNIVKDVKSGVEFSREDKVAILDRYVGMSEDNNSYFTPFLICKFMCDLLDIKGNARVADLSAGIGNMVRPLVTEYGKLKDNVQFDLYELDENNSIAGSKACEDFEQVTYYGECDTLSKDIDTYYDFVIGNPPFTGSVPYIASWNTDAKGKVNKKNDIVNAFIDKAVNVTKDGGYIALVLPSGFCFKGKATEKLRNYMSTVCELKLLMELDSDTFANAGVTGTAVGTVLCVWQKGKTKNSKTIFAELNSTDKLEHQLNGIVNEFKKVQGLHHLQMCSGYNDRGIYGKIFEGLLEDDEPVECCDVATFGHCYCCDKTITNNMYSEYTTKDGEEVKVCLECDNEAYWYYKKIRPNCLIDDEIKLLTKEEEKHLRILERERSEKDEQDRLSEFDKVVYYLSNSNGSLESMDIKNNLLEMCKLFQKCEKENMIKCRYSYSTGDKKVRLEDCLGLSWVEITYDGFSVEHYKSRKDKTEEWKDHVRYWHKGTITTSCDLYNATWGFSTIDTDDIKVCERVFVSYDFICSKSWQFANLIKELIDEGKL